MRVEELSGWLTVGMSGPARKPKRMKNTTDSRTADAPPGSLDPVVRRLDCYVGIKPCGCMVAWVYDDPKHPKDVANSVSDFIRSGYFVERANTDEVRHKLGKCKCAKPSNATDQATARRKP